MLQNYLSPYATQKFKSPLQCPYSQSNNQSLLLSNNVKQKRITIQQNQEYLLKLKDLIQIQNFQDKINELSMIEEPTIVKNDVKGQQIKSSQVSKEQNKHQILRLKRIVKNKNKIIGELTQQINILTQFINKVLLKNKSKKNQLKQDKQIEIGKRPNQKQNCFNEWKSNMQQQIFFLTKNNTDLYQQLKRIREISQMQGIQLHKIKKDKEEMTNKLNDLIGQNQLLKKQNEVLVKKVREYIKQDKRQIKIVNKIRQVLNQKTYHKTPHQEYKGIKNLYQQMQSIQNHKKQRHSRNIVPSSIMETPIIKAKSDQKRKKQEKKYNTIRNLSQQLKRT